MDGDMRAALGQIREIEPRSGPLEQSLSDEDAETHMLRLAAPPRNIGLAEARQEAGREAGTVIGDLDGDAGPVPGRGDAHLAPRELDGVLDEVAEAVHDLGAARHLRLAAGAGGRR